MATNHNTINVRLAHPFLWSLYLAYAIGCLLAALNFWFSNPTFDPWPGKNLVGVVFFVIGVWQFVFLVLKPHLDMVRIGSLGTVFVLATWGFLNLPQSLAGKASFQLPIWMFLLASIHFLLLLEAPVNPMTRKKP